MSLVFICKKIVNSSQANAGINFTFDYPTLDLEIGIASTMLFLIKLYDHTWEIVLKWVTGIKLCRASSQIWFVYEKNPDSDIL